jgi:16S rRNA (adenine1518-N6/adenine1519-N6)-dimethyltransferase
LVSEELGTHTYVSPIPYIVANLPYNVGTALLARWRWLGGELWPPGSGAYGRLSVLAQWRSTARLAMKVHRSAFVPPPKVTSAIVHIVPGAQPKGVAAATLERLTAAAFGQRRKMLRQSLKGLPGALEALARLGIDPDAAPRRSRSRTSPRSRPCSNYGDTILNLARPQVRHPRVN